MKNTRMDTMMRAGMYAECHRWQSGLVVVVFSAILAELIFDAPVAGAIIGGLIFIWWSQVQLHKELYYITHYRMPLAQRKNLDEILRIEPQNRTNTKKRVIKAF